VFTESESWLNSLSNKARNRNDHGLGPVLMCAQQTPQQYKIQFRRKKKKGSHLKSSRPLGLRT